jgi:Potential Queuosine, Q, salvage protein family
VVITDEIRDACAWVAGRATKVRIAESSIPQYAASLALDPSPPPSPAVAAPVAAADREATAAFWLTLDAINFGSGWFPTLRKREQPTGYRTIAAGIRQRFDRHGPWPAAELAEISSEELSTVLDQDPAHELLQLFAASLRDLGAHLLAGYDGSFAAVVDAAGGAAVALVERLAGWDAFADVSVYEGRRVAFLKRAQIAAADLSRAGVEQFSDIAELTLFADNLVPHVLRIDGVLEFDSELLARINRGELLIHDSAPEVEMRACAVHAVELIVAALAGSGYAPTAAQIDETLWNRGQGTDYKSVPRPRSRNTAY